MPSSPPTTSSTREHRDQPPGDGCTNCGGTVRSQKEHPTWGRGWYCTRCVRTAR